ncbi:MAG TPA: hypothetical protein VGP64_14865 [Polyangia bacterium]|jgi:hypothetical protein
MRPALALLAAAGLCACSSPSEPHGSPVLLGGYWLAGGQKTQIWTVTDPTLPATGVGAAGQEIDFVFDRLLDGNRIEDTVTVNGTQTTVPKATPPVTVTWPDAATVMSTPPFGDQVLYNSEPYAGTTNTAYVFLKPLVVGFPSSDTITFTLDKTGLTSAYGDQMIGPSQISVTTGAFSASFRLPQGSGGADAATAVPSNYMLPVVFSNRVAGTSAIAPFIQASAGGVTLPVVLAVDAGDPTVIYVSPASCLGGWPSGVAVEVTVAAGIPDAFGVPMATPAQTTFMASAATTAAPDGGCGIADAGSD